MENKYIEILSKILRLSNLEYCQDSDDLQNNLEKNNDLIIKEFPEINEQEDK